MNSVAYRSFRNADPPQLYRLWHECGLGRGAAIHFPMDVFDDVVFAQPYFDPQGLIVACIDGRVLGMVHAGFAVNAAETGLDQSQGVICLLLVHPSVRRQGIGQALLERAVAYLRERGARQIFAGPAPGRDPFYWGLYGGCQPSGFLESDPLAAPFFSHFGYQAFERHLVLQRDFVTHPDPVNIKLMQVRRSTKLVVCENVPRSWWWLTRMGRLEPLQMGLIPNRGAPEPLASVTMVGMDFYLPRWGTAAIGLTDLTVPECSRRKGYGMSLLIEVCRKVRQNMINLAETHVIDSNLPARAAIRAAGFEQVDVGIVYRAPD